MIASISSALLFQTTNMDYFLSDDCNSGNISLREILDFGNFGIGHFNDSEDGELIIMGGIAYHLPEPERSVPIDDFSIKPRFATVTRFQPERSASIGALPDYKSCGAELDKKLRDLSRNYAVLLRGNFSHLTFCPCTPRTSKSKAASELAPLTVRNVDGMLIGFRIANDVSPALHGPGYHFHGMSTPGVGGHILDMGIAAAHAAIQSLGELEVLNTRKPRRRPCS